MSNTFTIIESRVGDFTDFVRFCSVIGFDTCWECPNHNVTAFGQTRFAVFGFVLNGGKAKWVFATLNVFRAFDFTFGGIGITNCWSNTLLTTLNFSFILKFLTGSSNFFTIWGSNFERLYVAPFYHKPSNQQKSDFLLVLKGQTNGAGPKFSLTLNWTWALNRRQHKLCYPEWWVLWLAIVFVLKTLDWLKWTPSDGRK